MYTHSGNLEYEVDGDTIVLFTDSGDVIIAPEDLEDLYKLIGGMLDEGEV